MTIAYTVDELVSRVRRAAQLSTLNGKLSTDEIVTICDEEIQSMLWPLLRQASQDYQQTYATLTVPYYASASDPAGISGTVLIPTRASASTMSQVLLVRSDGTKVPLARLDYDDAAALANATSTEPTGYLIRENTLVLLPAPTQATTIRVYYERIPSQLVLLARAIGLQVSPTKGEFVYTGTLATTGTYARYDVVSRVPQLGPLLADVQATVFAVGQIRVYVTTSGDLSTTGIPGLPNDPSALVVNIPSAYLCSAGETAIFPLPDAWYSAAVSQCAARCALETGDMETAATMRDDANARIALLVGHASNRVRKQAQPYFDRKGTIRGGGRRGWYGS